MQLQYLFPEYANQINKLKKILLKMLRWTQILLQEQLKADKDEILRHNGFPYSKGYTVYVDGKKTDTFEFRSIAYLG